MLNLFQHLNEINKPQDAEPTSGRQNSAYDTVSGGLGELDLGARWDENA